MLAERAVEEERFGVGVVEQVDELFLEVAVVDVDRDGAQLEGPVQRLEVLVRVVEVRRDLGVGTEPGGAQRAGDAGGAVVELAPRPGPLALDQRGAVGQRVGDRFEDRGPVPVHVRVPPCSRARRILADR